MTGTLEGTILVGDEFEAVEGRLHVENGQIAEIEEIETDSSDIILPAFVNAHTHIGDSTAKEAGGGLSLDELVTPPDGLKHRLLRAASREEKVEAMRRSVRFMESTGTAAFLDFREGGVEGVEAIRDALAGRNIDPVIFGRETAAAMHAADGFGASGARDSEFGDLREAAREANKPFAIHTGERDPHDITPAMDLDPAFLVHMVHPREQHLARLDEEETPVVVCPRSNLVTNVGVPPIRELADRTNVALGTDNVMLNSPSMFREMEFAAKLADVSAEEVLRMATTHGAKLADKEYGVVEEGRPAKLLVLDGDSDNLCDAKDLVRAVVRRAGEADVTDVLL
ncbi:MAG: amidohydrolase family protein [Halolamina sp.]|uniref:amidohydrolase family protein n=1 Tax=Halolamina sp. TaxID=1940283 RepID=UPI002FC3277D